MVRNREKRKADLKRRRTLKEPHFHKNLPIQVDSNV